MSNEKAAEAIASMAALYGVLKYFSAMYDKLYVELKLALALKDPGKSSELGKCFEVHAKDLERWRCILTLIGAENIWEKYKNVWAKMDGMGGDR